MPEFSNLVFIDGTKAMTIQNFPQYPQNYARMSWDVNTTINKYFHSYIFTIIPLDISYNQLKSLHSLNGFDNAKCFEHQDNFRYNL